MKTKTFERLVILGLQLIVLILWSGVKDKACVFRTPKDDFIECANAWLKETE